MKTTDAIQDRLNLLYALQKEQEFQLNAGISKLSTAFTPVKIITDLIGGVVQKAPETNGEAPKSYSPLWDKLTDQIGITSPIAKSTIHLALDQLMSKWLTSQTPGPGPVVKKDKILSKELILDHSVNHF
jgi:hypothetical protein